MAIVGLVVNQDRLAATQSAISLAKWLADSGHDVRMPPGEAKITGCTHLETSRDTFAENLDMVVTLGGDGSILRAVEMIAETEVPILGVDFGRLGYLTEVQPCDARSAIERVLAGDFKIQERLLLEVTVHVGVTEDVAGRGQGAAESRQCVTEDAAVSRQDATGGSCIKRRYLALNEAFVERAPNFNTILVAVDLNGEAFTTYSADGLIVATPTGSTAYAFSAGGPIIDPSHNALIVTPVAPHMLFNRSLVISPVTRLKMSVVGERTAVLSIDGRRVVELNTGDSVECLASSCAAHFVTFGERQFHQVLKTKFGLHTPVV